MVRGICASYGNEASTLIEILHDVFAATGGISEVAMRSIADCLNLSRAEVYGVKSFYRDFARPTDRILVEICLGEACRACGTGALYDSVKPVLDAGGLARVEPVYCLGNCALSPAVAVDGVIHGRIPDADKVLRLVGGVGA
jgi:formate dehydrogenase subunit gamma